MKTRIITAAVALVIGALIFVFGEMNSVVITIAASILSGVMCGEFLSVKGLHKKPALYLPCLLFGALIPALAYTRVFFLPYYCFMLYLCVIAVVCHASIPLDDAMHTFFGVSMITLSMGMFTIRVCAANWHPTFWALLIFCVPWFADSAAYFVGSAIGKHKLCPNISPKKSVEGAVAGVIAGTVAPLLVGLIFYYAYGDLNVKWWILPIIGLVNSFLSIIGDLIFSVVKRRYDVKDYGNILPGHGGLLDRFDSVIFCVPFVYFLTKYIVIV